MKMEFTRGEIWEMISFLGLAEDKLEEMGDSYKKTHEEARRMNNRFWEALEQMDEEEENAKKQELAAALLKMHY